MTDNSAAAEALEGAHMSDDETRKPGWYPQPDGGKQRYWDGRQWLSQPRSPKLEERRAWFAAQQGEAADAADKPADD